MPDSNNSHHEQVRNARLRRMRSSTVLDVVERNIDDLLEHERANLEQRRFEDRLAERITNWSGSAWFFYLNVAFFGVWIAWNMGVGGLKPFDPFPFGFLTMIVSLEAIALAIFVLITQNRMQSESDRRAELDLQINLLTEYEITHLLRLTSAIAAKLECEEINDPELAILVKNLKPQEVLEQIESKRSG